MTADDPTSPPKKSVQILALALLCLLWGSTWIVIRGGLRDLPPYTSAAARFVVAGLGMALAARWLARREGGQPPPAWLWVTCGTLNFAASYAIVYRVETVLPSGLTSLLWGVFPLLMALLGHFFLPGERLRWPHWCGFTLGFAGLALLYATDVQAFGPRALPAALLLLASPLVCAVGNLAIKRHGAGVNSLLLNRNGMLLGAALLAVLALVTERQAQATWTPRAVLSVAYLSLGGTVVTFGLYFWLLRFLDAHKLSLIAYVTPAIAVTLGTTVGDEPLTPFTLAGTALIVCGIVLVVRTKR